MALKKQYLEHIIWSTHGEIQTLPFCVEFSYVYIYLKGTMYINWDEHVN